MRIAVRTASKIYKIFKGYTSVQEQQATDSSTAEKKSFL